MAFITKGIQLWMHVNTKAASGTTHHAMSQAISTNTESGAIGLDTAFLASGVYFKGLQEIGEMGLKSANSAGYDQIEVTTLADEKHVYVDGLIADNSDNESELTLKFLYGDVFGTFKSLQDEEAANDTHNFYFVSIPGTENGFNIEATVSAVTLDSMAVNAAVTCTVTLKVHNIEYGANKIPTWDAE